MKKLSICGFAIKPHASRGDGNGRMSYCIIATKASFRKTVKFPSDRVLRRLASQHLDCELTPEVQTMPRTWCNFTIDAGISYERRVAFLAAVMVNSIHIEQ